MLQTKIIGAQNWNPTFFTKLLNKYKLSFQVAQHLSHNYGSKALEVAELAQRRNLARPLAEGFPYLEAEVGSPPPRFECFSYSQSLSHLTLTLITTPKPFPTSHVLCTVYAAENEYARTAVDVLARRTRLAFLDRSAALSALPRVVDLLAESLSWVHAFFPSRLYAASLYVHLITP